MAFRTFDFGMAGAVTFEDDGSTGKQDLSEMNHPLAKLARTVDRALSERALGEVSRPTASPDRTS